jgi:hypothetical protein
MEDCIMNYGESSRRAAAARRKHVLDTIVSCGPMAALVLAAEERHQDAERQAAIWTATRAEDVRTGGAWRRRLGLLLIRAGHRLQGARQPAVEITGTAN